MKKKNVVIVVSVFVALIIIGVVAFLLLSNKKVTISFNVDGGTAVESIKVKKGEEVKLPTTTKEGYVFEGWYDGNTKLEEKAKFEKDVTLKANWLDEEAETFTITFDSKGGSKVAELL